MANTHFNIIIRMQIEPHGLPGLAAPLLRRRMQPMFKRDLANTMRDRKEPSGSLGAG